VNLSLFSCLLSLRIYYSLFVVSLVVSLCVCVSCLSFSFSFFLLFLVLFVVAVPRSRLGMVCHCVVRRVLCSMAVVGGAGSEEVQQGRRGEERVSLVCWVV
jgi:4-hydroxybenzoate polyprenyltransferase